ncbi:MAG: S-adenosylmethionine transporter [Alyxoria varia]|nr:MAG: S-adenosylmethionine transporter [Alyxoria varia]
MSDVKHFSIPFILFVFAGGVAGTTVDLSLYPIDTLKTRLQSARGFAASGGFRGVYQGVGSAVIGSAPGAALFFVTYEGAKDFFGRSRHFGRHAESSDELLQGQWHEAGEHMMAASLGEVAACAVRVPTEVVKQRAQASRDASSIAALRAILAIRHEAGLSDVWKGLYRGWTITVIREVPFTVIQFPLWEAMKKWSRNTQEKPITSTGESALFGCLSGAVAAALTTPLDVLKTRMMLATDKVPLTQLTKSIFRDEGSKGFFVGLTPRVGWIAAGGAVFLGSYQLALNMLRARLGLQ